jgi:hypothetical protein
MQINISLSTNIKMNSSIYYQSRFVSSSRYSGCSIHIEQFEPKVHKTNIRSIYELTGIQYMKSSRFYLLYLFLQLPTFKLDNKQNWH